jgi:cell division transport system permease protein
MALPQKLFAPAFAEPKTRWLFLLLVGVMVYIATFALAVEGLVSTFTLTWDQGMDRRMTVEVPVVEDEGAAPQSERVKQIIAALGAMPEIMRTQALPDEQTQQLLRPWISQVELLKTLPVPSLIDIDRNPGATLSATELKNRLKPIIANIQVDDHAVWLADLLRVVHGLMVIAAVIIVLTGVAVVFAVSLLCRVVVATEHETISLLHIMGAEDDDIAHYFQRHVVRLSIPPALIGFFCGLASAGALIFLMRQITDGLFLNWLHWTVLGGVALLIPIVSVSIAALSARLTVKRLLNMVA